MFFSTATGSALLKDPAPAKCVPTAMEAKRIGQLLQTNILTGSRKVGGGGMFGGGGGGWMETGTKEACMFRLMLRVLNETKRLIKIQAKRMRCASTRICLVINLCVRLSSVRLSNTLLRSGVRLSCAVRHVLRPVHLAVGCHPKLAV